MEPSLRSVMLNTPPNLNIRFRAIAPRPLAESPAKSDGNLAPSPQSSVDASPSPSPHRQQRKRRASRVISRPGKRPLIGNSPPLTCLDNLDPLSRLRALEGTPLGKLLKAAPDIPLGAKRCDSPLGSDMRAHSSPPTTPKEFFARPPFPFSPLSPLMPRQTLSPHLCPASYTLPSSLLLPPSARSGGVADMDVEPAASDKLSPFPLGSGLRRTSVNAEHMERVYGESEEPAMVTDEEQHVLWANRAFAVTAGKVLGPTGVDLQGSAIASPVPVTPLWYCPPDGREAERAILWGFLKKDVRLVGADMAEKQGGTPVLCPQPVRSVESFVRLTCHAALTGGGVEAMEGSFGQVEARFEGLDQCSTPVLITNVNAKVRWVNAAYKLLIGQPRCTWLESTARGGCPQRLMGEVAIEGMGENMSGWPALSCTAEVRWGQPGGGRGTPWCCLPWGYV